VFVFVQVVVVHVFVWDHVATVWVVGDQTVTVKVDQEKYLFALSSVILVFHDVRYTSLFFVSSWSSYFAFETHHNVNIYEIVATHNKIEKFFMNS